MSFLQLIRNKINFLTDKLKRLERMTQELEDLTTKIRKAEKRLASHPDTYKLNEQVEYMKKYYCVLLDRISNEGKDEELN